MPCIIDIVQATTMPWSAGYIINTFESKFSVHTGSKYFRSCDKSHRLAVRSRVVIRARGMWGARMKIKEIAEVMIGNQVWCRNGWLASVATPCEKIECTFKNSQRRLATAKELYRCRCFQITTPSNCWETATHILPRHDR
jgi:hypothetical protein